MWATFEEVPVLVVEDSDDDLVLLQRAFRRVGVRNPLIVAYTGDEALAQLQAAANPDGQFPGIIFLDMMMPGTDGTGVLQWLRSHEHPPTVVVLHTGVEDEHMLQRARDLGATLHLPKGVRLEAIREVFDRARAEWEHHPMAAH